MMIFPTSRPFSFSHLTGLLSLVTSNALARWPRATYLMNSDVAWRLPGPKPEDDCATLKYTTRNLIETEDGIFASYCIGLIDPPLGVGSIEPVGTRPAFRRMGLGQQVNYEGLHRMKEKGMHSAKIGTAGFNDPAFGLYSSCGFDLIDRERTYTKSL
ncbi:MAG: GNAT family N-acetyltransferase [Gammaproteobacteria bacterium]|nr:GNAT family N-acetyltransferase [Gammaproteobacteria bacterium]